jgi:hypothetical protein
MSLRILGTMLTCSLAVACSAGDTRTVAPKPTSDESACVSYGFVPGTTAYTTCVAREAEARRRGRLGPSYDQILIAREAREDCVAYGLAPGTPVYERCVQQEISYRLPN